MAIKLGVLDMLGLVNSRRGRRMSKNELAERLETNERSIRRWVADYNMLVDYEVPNLPFSLPRMSIVQVDGRAWVTIEPRSIGAEAFQYAAVYCALQLLQTIDPEGLGDTLEGILERLDIGESQRALIPRLQQAFYYRPFAAKAYPEETFLDEIVAAVMYRHPVELEYISGSKGRVSTWHVEPYTLVMYREGFYVLVHKPGEDLWLLAVDRITSCKTRRDVTFTVPERYTPEEYFRGQFGTWRTDSPSEDITIAFDASAARNARERQWPGLVGWRELNDGRHAVDLQVPITPELVSWVLSWGPTAEVLTPVALRDDIAERFRSALSRYEEPAAG